MEEHPILGERILEPIEQLEEVRRIVRSAHEHFDGTGYPDGLAGEEIPIESRIVLVCDAYHAMTTDRPYRRAIGIEEAKARLREGSGQPVRPERGRRAPPHSLTDYEAPAASALRSPRNAHVQKATPNPIAIANAPRTCGASPAMNPRPVSRR